MPGFHDPDDQDDEDDLVFSDPNTATPDPASPAETIAHSAADDDMEFTDPNAGNSEGDRAPEPAWYEELLGGLQSMAGGITKEGQLGIHGLMDPAAQAKLRQVEHDYPNAHRAGEVIGDVGLGLMGGPSAAGQAAMGALSGAAGAAGRGGDAQEQIGGGLMGGVVGGTLGKLTNALVGPAARSNALRRSLTRGGDVDAQNAIDRILGGDSGKGTVGSGIDYLMQRARQLAPEGASPEELKNAANAATAERQPFMEAMEQLSPGDYRAHSDLLEQAAGDPVAANWIAGSDNLLGRLGGARDAMLKKAPYMADDLREHAADRLIGRASLGQQSGQGFWDAISPQARDIARPGSMSGRMMSRGLGFLANKMAGAQGAEGFAAGASGVGAAGAGYMGERMAPAMAPPIAKGEDKAYAGAPTLSWTLGSVLSSGTSGLDPRDEQRLSEAMVEGNPDKIYAIDFALRMKNPGYARRIEEELKALNGQE